MTSYVTKQDPETRTEASAIGRGLVRAQEDPDNSGDYVQGVHYRDILDDDQIRAYEAEPANANEDLIYLNGDEESSEEEYIDLIYPTQDVRSPEKRLVYPRPSPLPRRSRPRRAA